MHTILMSSLNGLTCGMTSVKCASLVEAGRATGRIQKAIVNQLETKNSSKRSKLYLRKKITVGQISKV